MPFRLIAGTEWSYPGLITVVILHLQIGDGAAIRPSEPFEGLTLFSENF